MKEDLGALRMRIGVSWLLLKKKAISPNIPSNIAK